MPYKADNITREQETKINSYLLKLESYSKLITSAEKQYLYLKYLESMELTDKQVFDIFTNSVI